jgi:hypothetical protein
MSIDTILKEIALLTVEERTELKARITEQFPDGEVERSPDLSSVLAERDAAYEANPSEVHTWEEIIARLKQVT